MGHIRMYIVEWVRDFELIERQDVQAETIAEVVTKAKSEWPEIAARCGRAPNRFRVKDRRLKELVVVALPKHQDRPLGEAGCQTQRQAQQNEIGPAEGRSDGAESAHGEGSRRAR